LVELTEEDKKNGWTEEKLQKYLEDRDKAQSGIILFNNRKPQRPKWANNSFNPLRWRQ
jgi:hypothetical protein